MKLFSGIANVFFNEQSNDPYVRIAEVEYNKEFRMFVKSNGRRPTNEEAKYLILG